jgi:hypothetical protein
MTQRRIALSALPLTVAAVLYAAGSAVFGWEPSVGWLFQAFIHAGEFLAVLALAMSQAAGTGRTARIALGAAMAGEAALVVAEVVWPHTPAVGDALFSAGPLLTGVGLVVAGILVVRRGHWTGWRRWAPLAVGAYVFVALMPVMIGSGGPPAPVALWTIAGWDLLWSLVAVAALHQTSTVDAQRPPAVAATR